MPGVSGSPRLSQGPEPGEGLYAGFLSPGWVESNHHLRGLELDMGTRANGGSTQQGLSAIRLSADLALQEDGQLWCCLDLGVLLTLGRAQPHSDLLCWEQGSQPNCRHPAGKTQLPREDIGSHNPSLLLWIPEREQLAVGFSYQETLHTEQKIGSPGGACGMRGMRLGGS